MRILILEDNYRFATLLQDHLRDAGYVADIAETIDDFYAFRANAQFDLYLIDLTLPDGDGVDLIKTLRQGNIATPVIIITARAHLESRLAGLDAGADDYLVKPFHHSELLARSRAVLRRGSELRPETVRVGHLALTLENASFDADGQRLDLRPSERRLLLVLARNIGHTISREMIENGLGGADYGSSQNAIDKLVSRLRRALQAHDTGLHLRTVKGVGYALEDTTR